MSEKLITRQQLGLVGRRKSAGGIPQSRPRACSGGKFVPQESRAGVQCPSWRSKSEIPAEMCRKNRDRAQVAPFAPLERESASASSTSLSLRLIRSWQEQACLPN